MTEQKKDEAEVSISDRPTEPRPPKPGTKVESAAERSKGLRSESISLGKIFGMSVNDDALFERTAEDGRSGLYAVADGLGGEAGGDVASQTVMEVLEKYVDPMDEIRKHRAEGRPEATVAREADLLRKAIRESNSLIVLKRGEMEAFPHMGTTCVAARVTEDEDGHPVAIIAHVGDSRAYLLSPEGKLTTLTLDDHITWLLSKMRFGEEAALRLQHVMDCVTGLEQLDAFIDLINRGYSVPPESGLTDEDIRFFMAHMDPAHLQHYEERSNEVSNVVGSHPEVHVKTIPVEPGSKLILCSDGVDGLTFTELESLAAGRLDELPHESIRLAAQSFGDRTAEAITFAAKERQEEYRPPVVHPRSRGTDDTTTVVVSIPPR